MFGILAPLAVIGAFTSMLHLQRWYSQATRWILRTTDPIAPGPNEIIDFILHKPLVPLDQVEEYIREDSEGDDQGHSKRASEKHGDTWDGILNNGKTQKRRPVVEGAERIIDWAGGRRRQKTPICVVFLHGWAGCRQEGRPVVGRIAKSLNANLYCARLPGHGRLPASAKDGKLFDTRNAMPDATALLEEATPRACFWEALEALRIGLSLGDRVVFIGVSTGGGLATWLATIVQQLIAYQVRETRGGGVSHSELNTNQLQPDALAGMVLISPAYAFGHPAYPIMKHTCAALRLLPKIISQPIRAFLMSKVIGKERRVTVLNDDHRRYNCVQYPSAVVLHLMDILYELETVADPNAITIPTMMVGNPQDTVANFRATSNAFLKLGDAPNKVLYCMGRGEHKHVVCCDFVSPSSVEEVYEAICLFLRTNIVDKK